MRSKGQPIPKLVSNWKIEMTTEMIYMDVLAQEAGAACISTAPEGRKFHTCISNHDWTMTSS